MGGGKMYAQTLAAASGVTGWGGALSWPVRTGCGMSGAGEPRKHRPALEGDHDFA